MVGANPLVSHGSVLSAPRVREQLNAVVDRGGRVVVVDPAPHGDGAPVRARRDPPRHGRVAAALDAAGRLRGGARGPRLAGARRTGRRDAGRARARLRPGAHGGDHRRARAETVRELARAFAAAPSAAAYGRTGSCLGRFGTLVAYLLDALNAVTGNLDRPGGAVFGRPPIALDDIGEKAGLATYGKVRSRFGELPRRDRQPAGDADPEGDHDAGRAPDPRVLRVGRQPGAVRARRRRARGGVRRARPDGVARLLRDRDEPARRLRPARHDVPRARGRARSR